MKIEIVEMSIASACWHISVSLNPGFNSNHSFLLMPTMLLTRDTIYRRIFWARIKNEWHDIIARLKENLEKRVTYILETNKWDRWWRRRPRWFPRHRHRVRHCNSPCCRRYLLDRCSHTLPFLQSHIHRSPQLCCWCVCHLIFWGLFYFH